MNLKEYKYLMSQVNELNDNVAYKLADYYRNTRDEEIGGICEELLEISGDLVMKIIEFYTEEVNK